MEYAQYEEVPKELTGRIVEEHRAERHGVATHQAELWRDPACRS